MEITGYFQEIGVIALATLFAYILASINSNIKEVRKQQDGLVHFLADALAEQHELLYEIERNSRELRDADHSKEIHALLQDISSYLGEIQQEIVLYLADQEKRQQ